MGVGGVKVEIGQRWRQDDGYLCDVVGFSKRGWPLVRHPNAKGPGNAHPVNPKWFDRWELVQDVEK